MKTIIIKITILVYVSIQFSNFTFCQSQYLGKWEGKFMNDFKTIIEINSDDNDNLSGKIQMFSGPDLIQDDQISNISVRQNLVTFRINAKDTDFKGEFINDNSEITGVFVFPDKSEHPLKLTKSAKKELLDKSSTELYWELKNKKYKVDELKEDFDFLIGNLKEVHPQLYLYTSREKFDKLTEETMKSLTRELSIIEYYNLIAPVIEFIKCSHTGIRLPVDVQNAIYSNDNFFPLKLLFAENKAFCIKSYGNTKTDINTGVEILSINNIPIQRIKDELYRFIPSEGNNTSTKNYELNQNFNSWFNLIDNSDRFEIEFVKEDIKQKSSVNACSYSVLEEKNKTIQNEMPIKFFVDKENNIGFLTVKSFMIGDINTFIREVDGIFKELQNKKAQHLVIDLRGNSGGHPIFAAQLFSYLTNKDFIYFKRNNDVKEFEPLYNKMQANELNFKGDISVFVDGGCLSTTGHLISLLKDRTNALFVGEEPGSTYRCNDFSLKQILPNTKIEVNIPRTTFETAVSDAFELTPFEVDFKVYSSINDCLTGNDGYVKFINNLILKP